MNASQIAELRAVAREMERDATISACGLYRYSLTRSWGEGKRFVAWIMLNPSTADATVDDPTIRRCIAFSKAWGYDALEVVNLFALRSPNPEDLRDCQEAGMDPVGPENDRMLDWTLSRADVLVAAWGAHKMARARFDAIRWLPALHRDKRLQCLGTTKDGSPRHPLYVPGSASLVALVGVAP